MDATVRAPSAQPRAATLRVAMLASLFGSLAAAAYVLTDSELSPGIDLFLSFGPLLMVILWLQQDAGRTGVGTVHDWGYFLLLGWPVVIPWYAFRTRGRDGWRLAVLLFALILSPYITGTVLSYALWFGRQA